MREMNYNQVRECYDCDGLKDEDSCGYYQSHADGEMCLWRNILNTDIAKLTGLKKGIPTFEETLEFIEGRK